MSPSFSSLSTAVTSGPTAQYVNAFRALNDGQVQMGETYWPTGTSVYSRRPELTLTRAISVDAPNKKHRTPEARIYQAGDFELAPADCQDTVEIGNDGRYVSLAIPVMHLEEVAGLRAQDFGVLHEGTFRCPQLSILVDHLWTSLEPNQPGCHLLSEGLYQAIIGQLNMLCTKRVTDLPASAAQLTPGAMHEIDSMIADLGPSKLNLQSFASQLSMSVPTFTRRFKATTGQSVHQYVLNKRLTHAKQLLVQADFSVAQIAYKCGFSSQSHMTDVFRKKLGVTPASYRMSFR